MTEIIIAVIGLLIASLQAWTAWITRQTRTIAIEAKGHAEIASVNATLVAKKSATAHTELAEKLDEIQTTLQNGP